MSIDPGSKLNRRHDIPADSGPLFGMATMLRLGGDRAVRGESIAYVVMDGKRV